MTDPYLEVAAGGDAAGQKVGKLPRSVKLNDLKGLGHPHSPIKAIRAKCVDCCGGNVAEARRCHLTHCPLWAFRMGHNPFFGKSEDSTTT